MKYAVFFLLCCVALSAAAPQLITSYPGLGAWGVPGAWGTHHGIISPIAPRTLVAGPTVINGYTGGRIIAPGYVGPAYI